MIATIRVALAVTLSVAACTPAAPPRVAQYPTAAETSLDCVDNPVGTALAICTNATLAAAERRLSDRWEDRAGDASLFERDRLLAERRFFFARLAAGCAAKVSACILDALTAEDRRLAAAPANPPNPEWGDNAYVAPKPLPQTAGGKRCASVQSAMERSLAASGRLDPSFVVAGTGSRADEAVLDNHRFTVERRRSGAAGGYRRGGVAVVRDGAPIFAVSALGAAVQRGANEGGRAAAVSSQTGDAAVLDLRADGTIFVADPVGEFTPNGPGESAAAGLFTAGTPPAPLCFWTTYRVPDEIDAELPAPLASWLASVDALHAMPPPGIDPYLWRDSLAEARSARWLALAMPLKLRALATTGRWTEWLRRRHDDVVARLRAAAAAGDGDARRVLDGARGAALSLLDLYNRQGLGSGEAREAAAASVLELTYTGTLSLAPDLGRDMPEETAGHRPAEPVIPAL